MFVVGQRMGGGSLIGLGDGGERGRGRTESSCNVNMCLRITTLSHLELVSWRVLGSSSSQSASLLCPRQLDGLLVESRID